MSKELEALNGIKQAFASHLVRETSMTFEQALESLNYDTDLQNIEKALKELAEIKARGEELYADSELEENPQGAIKRKLINYIIKGETK